MIEYYEFIINLLTSVNFGHHWCQFWKNEKWSNSYKIEHND